MLRHLFAGAISACLSLFLCQADAAGPVLSASDAITQARNLVAQNKPAEAVTLLESQLHLADGNKEFKDVLRMAYSAEIRLLTNQKADSRTIDAVRTKLSLLGGTPSDVLPTPIVPPTEPTFTAAPTPPPAPTADSQGMDALKQATAAFNEAKSTDPRKFADAAKLFAQAHSQKAALRKDHLAAWAYCRIKLAAEALNKPVDARTASDIMAEVEEALALVPDHEQLKSVGQDVLSTARKRGGISTPKGETLAGDWQALENDNFRVVYQGSRTTAEATLRTAETKRNEIAAMWSGPLGGAWRPKCEIVLHPNAESFTRLTQMPNGSMGRAEVKLKDGRATNRRLDLRADDTRLLEDTLPRELTYIVLADLFADQAPPKWAELGMAVYSASETERNRYARTLGRCAKNRELLSVSEVLKARDIPTDGVTGFCVESVSLVDYLVRMKGEKAFTSFLRDSQRYGMEAALKRQYGFADVRAFEDGWRRAALGN